MNIPPIIAGYGVNTAGINGDMDKMAERLDRVEEAGCSHVELSIMAIDVVLGGKINPSQLRRVRKTCRGRRLRYTMHGSLMTNLMDEMHLDLHKRVVEASIAVCHELEADPLVMHPGTFQHRNSGRLPQLLEVEKAAMTELAETAEKYGVRLAMENLPPQPSVMGAYDPYSLDTAVLARQVEAIGRPMVQACLDVSHAFQAAHYLGRDFRESMEVFAHQVCHLHVHDAFGPSAALPQANIEENLIYGFNDSHLPVGWGAVDWDALIDLPFQPGTVMIMELPVRFYHALTESAETMRNLAERINAAAADCRPARQAAG